MTAERSPAPLPEHDRGYEVADVTPGPVLAAALVLSLVVALTAFGVTALFRQLEGRAAARDDLGHARFADTPPPGPQLQAYPARELEEHRALEASRTETYGWIDRAEGVVRLPVERAMELIVERGLPSRPAAPGAGVPDTGASASGGVR